MKNWINENKVFLAGLLTAVALTLTEILKAGETSIKLIVFAGFIAAASYLARNLRGQWATIAGLVGNGLAAYLTMLESGSVSWAQLILQFIIGMLAIIAAPAKSIGYEKSPIIEEARREGEVIKPSTAPKPPDA